MKSARSSYACVFLSLLLLSGWLWNSSSGFTCLTSTAGAAVASSPKSSLQLKQPSSQQSLARGGRSKGVALLSNVNNKNNNISNNNNDPSEPDPRELKLNWGIVKDQIRLVRQMALPYYEESSTGRFLLAGVLALTLINSGVSVAFSYLSKDFWNALSAKDAPEFYHVLQQYLGALLIGAPVVTFYKYQRDQLAVHWREWMTARTFSLYVKNRVYYNLPATVDNPDQRIAEDVNTFTGYSLQFIITILTSLIDLASFSTILWSIYPQLFGAIILYAFIGTTVTAFLGQTLVGLNFFQLQREADLRYILVRLRDNAESIAFYGGEDLEGQAVEQKLERVMNNKRRINAANRNLEFFTTAYRYLIQIVPVAVVAPQYFAGSIALGVISQSTGAFNHILSDLSIIINQFERLSSFSAGIQRLASFYQAMQQADLARRHTTNNTTQLLPSPTEIDNNQYSNNDTDTAGVERISLQRYSHVENVILSVQHLDLYTPDQRRMLVQDLNFELRLGQHLLIVGNSGAGKSSLLRGIAGLWTAGRGTIHRPDEEHVYFLPQRPYCTLGSLKDQLLYPLLEYFFETENITAATTTSTTSTTSESSSPKTHSTTTNKSSFGSSATSDRAQKIVPRGHILNTRVFSDEHLVEVLQKVDLLDVAHRAGNGDPIQGLYAIKDWTNVLSLGEQQRLAFGRLLVNQPKLVILDEATSALDMVAEARMYTLLQNMARKQVNGNTISPPGLTYISVGHRPSLLAYHDKQLRLSGPDVPYEWSDIEKSSMTTTFSNLVQNL